MSTVLIIGNLSRSVSKVFRCFALINSERFRCTVNEVISISFSCRISYKTFNCSFKSSFCSVYIFLCCVSTNCCFIISSKCFCYLSIRICCILRSVNILCSLECSSVSFTVKLSNYSTCCDCFAANITYCITCVTRIVDCRFSSVYNLCISVVTYKLINFCCVRMTANITSVCCFTFCCVCRLNCYFFYVMTI